MTMIACTLNIAMPVLVGDLLISSDYKQETFELPVLSEDVMQYLSKDADVHPILLRQKLYILKKNVCVAFAGDVVNIRKFLEDIRIYCNVKDEITMQDMNDFMMQHIDNPSWKTICFIILISERHKDFINVGRFTHGEWLTTNSQLFGETWATGSGADDFMNVVAESVQMISNCAIDSPDYVIQLHLVMISRLLANERKTLNSVRKHWGAGFEMIYFDGKEFKKPEEITYLINYGNYTEEGDIPEVPIPAIILNYKYYNEYLVITVIRALSGNTSSDDNHYYITSNNLLTRRFVVTPFNCTKDVTEIENLGKDYSFTSNLNVMSYLLETEGYYYSPASINFGKELEVIHQNPDTLSITMMKPINDIMKEEVKRFVASQNGNNNQNNNR